MTCAMKREAWTWYLTSHLVPAKILFRGVNHVLTNFVNVKVNQVFHIIGGKCNGTPENV